MLDLAPDAGETPGARLPRGWHFVLLAADTRRSELRGDGFPGLGVPMPDLGLPRLMLGGRTVEFHHDIPVGAEVSRTSGVRSLAYKQGSGGDRVVVTVAHDLVIKGQTQAAVSEAQTYLLLPARAPGAKSEVGGATQVAPPVQAHRLKRVVPDETLLFQYSALGFNSHRIHLDREHAQKVEGFPDLVVNGGLITLLLTEFLRCDLGVAPAAITVKHVAALYCNRAITLAADPSERGWHLRAFDDLNGLAVDMEVTV